MPVWRPSAGEVYEQLAPAVVGYFRGQGVRDPEDLTGDVFVNVTRRLDHFKGDEAALRRWVFSIAHNRLVDEFRRTNRRREQIVADLPERGGEDVSGLFDDDLLRALAALTDDQREVVVLRFVADLPLEDVAGIVGKRQGAVKMLQARGLDALRVSLSEVLGDGP